MVPFKFSTKAETLKRLAPLLKVGAVLPQHHFTVGEWKKNKPAIAAKTLKELADAKKLAVRSSAVNEDSHSSSMAGNFTSCLNVQPNGASLEKAVETVIASYGNGGHASDANQVLVQPQIENLEVSGVAFTCDLDTGAPYYIVNYDDISGKTDVVTSGTSNKVKMFVYSKFYGQKPTSPNLALIISAVRELEKATGSEAIDIEFAVSKGKFFVLQVRPITTAGRKRNYSQEALKQELDNIKRFIRENKRSFPNLFGSRNAYGIMPDWNPAEIVGVNPKPLALSMYKEIITDYIWPLSRKEVGYKDVGYHPGLCSLSGKPYIDIRLSLSTFLAADIPDALAQKLVDFQLNKLQLNPMLHDKIEFQIAHTAYSLNFKQSAEELLKNGFSKEEVEILRKCLLKLTNNILAERVTSVGSQMALVSHLDAKRRKIRLSDIPIEVKIAQLVHDCKYYGTLPFSKLARFAFIASILMRSLRERGVITQAQYDGFFSSIETVATEFVRDIGEMKAGKMTRAEFLNRYGHLRPGTYDITSLTYAENLENYIDLKHYDSGKTHEKFAFDAATIRRIDGELKAQGVEANAHELLKFVEEATIGREKSKLEFTKNLSLALDYCTQYLHRYGIDREDAAFLEIGDLLAASHDSKLSTAKGDLEAKIGSHKASYEMTKAVRLPPLIFDEKNVEYFHYRDDMPNFVSDKRVSAEAAYVAANTTDGALLDGKIALIENADPGFDWIFSHNIKGLVTKFGGANSHMAIRSAEFGLPAAIGCGQVLFAYLKDARKIEIDCSVKQIRKIQ
jgi:phosphohistidine swiveling domain-containing protein